MKIMTLRALISPAPGAEACRFPAEQHPPRRSAKAWRPTITLIGITSAAHAGSAPAGYCPPMTVPMSPQVILELSSAIVAGRALQVVAEIGIADCLDDQPRTAADLAAATSADPDALARILRLLEERGVFGRDAEGRWVHTEASRLLRSDHPQSLRAFARMTGTPFCWDALGHLHHAVRTGRPASPGCTRADGSPTLTLIPASAPSSRRR